MSDRKKAILAVVRVTSGNFLEMYDFMIFGYYARSIGAAFFPSGNETTSLLLSLATFGAGFLMRPLGAVVLGAYIDTHGRRAGLLLTLALMATGTLSIACTPTYASIGVVAPLLVVLGRLLQGFSAGVELGGVSIYLSEIATPANKGFFVSWQSASQQAAVVFAAVLGFALTLWLSPEDLSRWGFRIPMLVGCLIIPFLFLIRRSLGETEAFLARTHRPTPRDIARSVLAGWKIVVTGVLLVTMTTVSFYVITAYTPTFAGTVLKLQARDYLVVTTCVGLSNFFWLPIMGALSDRVGRRPLLFTASALVLLTAHPMMSWLTAAPSFSRLLTTELWISFLYATYNGSMVAYLTELMPADVKTVGFSFAYSMATAIFGGFTPFVCTFLVERTKNPAMPGVWLSFAASLGLFATWLTRRGSLQRFS